MYFSPIALGITALFVLAKFAAAESDHVDAGFTPLSHKQAHPRPSHHHHYEGDESLLSSHRYPSQEAQTKFRQRELFSPGTQHAPHNAPAKGSSKLNDDSVAQLEKQSIVINEKIASAANDHQALLKSYAGMGDSSFVQKNAKIQSLFKQLLGAYHQQSTVLHEAQARPSYRKIESEAIAGRRVVDDKFDGLFRRGNLAQLKKQILAIGAKIDEAAREHRNLERSFGGLGWAGIAMTDINDRSRQIDSDFKQLHDLFYRSAPTFYLSVYGKARIAWGP